MLNDNFAARVEDVAKAMADGGQEVVGASTVASATSPA
jgi:hypothetical protein